MFEVGGEESPVIFPVWINHSDILACGADDRPISAGFVDFYEYDGPDGGGAAECYGTSTTLKISSRPEEDSDIITRLCFS